MLGWQLHCHPVFVRLRPCRRTKSPAKTDWEADINRPAVVRRGDTYHLWYTGQARERSWIGYATSPDGLKWTKHAQNPVFRSDVSLPWERHKVTACQVLQQGDWHLMFYIGFRDRDHAQIGLAIHEGEDLEFSGK
jgi:predicted GH43/DUF377 family glycosyl hydrolase